MTKVLKTSCLSFIIIVLLFAIPQGCKDDPATPVSESVSLTTNAITNIKSKSVVCGGNITSDGGKEIKERGVCWSVNENPDIVDGKVALSGKGSGQFTTDITSLQPNTTYFARAFAVTADENHYGNQVSFTTAVLENGEMKVMVAGVKFEPTTITATADSKLTITAVKGNEKIIINLPLNPAIGEHPFAATGDYTAQFIDPMYTYTSTSGKFFVAKYDASSGEITGTFEFNAKDDTGGTIKITEGMVKVYHP